MNNGDIVIVIDNKTIPSELLGRYGKVISYNDRKVLIEFNMAVKGRGEFSCTCGISDLKKFGD